MEQMTISKFENDAIQEKKLDNYGWNKNDYLAGQELTVTITIGEYRELVASKAISDEKIKASDNKAYNAEQEMKKAKEVAERLKAENYDLQNQLIALRSKAQEAAKKLCPFKKRITKDYNGHTGKTTLQEMFEECAGERCMAYLLGKCARLEGR